MRKKNVRLDEGLALAHQTRKFGSPGAVALWVTLLVPFCFGIALAVLVEPDTVPTCYTSDHWNWEHLSCLENSTFSLAQLSLESSGQCSCVLEEGYKYYIGGPQSLLDCGLSLCVYLNRQGSSGYMFQSCTWDDGISNATTVSAKLLPDGNGVFMDAANANVLCAGNE